MVRRLQTVKRGHLAALCGVVVALCFSASASAFTGEFAKFNECPTSNHEVFKCLYSVTTGGKFVLGSKEADITNPVTLQGGYSETNREKKHISKFFGAANGVTLSKTKEEVKGGLLGIVPPEKAPALVKLLIAFFFDNSLTEVNATLELDKSASEIEISEFNISNEEELALKLPVKVHLENPFLGSSCYVGPITLNLTSGTTTPPVGVTPLVGNSGKAELKENGEIAQLNGNELVENDWTAPEASGCGGVISFLVDPVLNLESGLPAKAGVSSAVLKNTIDIATPESVTNH